MSFGDQETSRGWDDEGKAELAQLIRDEEVDPYSVDAPYIKSVWVRYFDYLKLKNFYANYRAFVKGFTKGNIKDGARRREAEAGGKYWISLPLLLLRLFLALTSFLTSSRN
jgi:hypothetical protein